VFRSQQRKTRVVFAFLDALFTAAAFEIAYLLRQWLPLSLNFYLGTDVKALLLGFSVVTFVAFGHWLNVSNRVEAGRTPVILFETLRQAGASALCLVVFVFVLKLDISRVFLGLFFLCAWLLLAAARVFARHAIPAARREFGVERFVLIAGTGDRAFTHARTLEAWHNRGVRIVGFLATTADAPATVSLNRDYDVFPLPQLPSMLARHVIDEVHFAVESSELPSLDEAFVLCDEEGVCSRIALDFFPHVNSDIALERIGDTPLLTFTATPDDAVLLLAKRAIDVLGALAALILLSPFLLLVALLVKATSRGPVIFRQQRCGLNGRTFTFYKFRSMVEDAEARVHEVAHLNTKHIVMKIPNDPRQTALGKWLRRFSIDELPQLFNVLRGDMSLVGPRPALPSEVAQYQRWQRRRLRMRPGLTCLWAVEGRDTVDFESWMRLDMEYIDNWSLSLDARILLLTIPQVLSGRAH
jgi:exopolysaccharide biosynthesis polyprenyl glycosylphosphotransferase